MKRFELKLTDKILEELDTNTENKSEYIRQAIMEKLDRKTNTKNVLTKVNELEKMLFVLNQKLQVQEKIMLKIIEENYKINVMIFELHNQQNKEKYKDKLQEYIDAKIKVLKNELLKDA